MRKVTKIEVGTDDVQEDIRTYKVGVDGVKSINETFSQHSGDPYDCFQENADGTAVRHLSVLRVYYAAPTEDPPDSTTN